MSSFRKRQKSERNSEQPKGRQSASLRDHPVPPMSSNPPEQEQPPAYDVEDDTESAPGNPPVSSFPAGIQVLYDCHDAIVDICFVPGLTGDRDTTWSVHEQSNPWPKTLLPSKLSKARILTYGYDVYDVRKSVFGSNSLFDHAQKLLLDLAIVRDLHKAVSRPLIFVTHSLGGLVCKKAILLSQNNPESSLRDVFDSTKGIVFMGTPHRGAWMTSWAIIPASALGFVNSTKKSLLQILNTDDEYLESIQLNFWEMTRALRESGRRLEIICFFEELPLPKVGIVVSKESATLDGYKSTGIHANHRDMVKFGSMEDSGFKRLLGELIRWASHIGNGNTDNLAERDCQGINDNNLMSSITAPQAAFNALEKRHEPLCLPNTRVQVLQQIRTWADGNDERYIFWLSGHAGTGKSTIARTIAREYYNKGCFTASFFFSGLGGDVSHAEKFAGTLALQLAQRCTTFMSFLVKAISDDEDISNRTTKDQWNKLVMQPLSKLGASSFQAPLLIVIDALDECEKESGVPLVLQLLSDFQHLGHLCPRVFITSRPGIPVPHDFSLVPQQDFVLHDISRSIVDDDIYIFLAHTLAEIRQEQCFDMEWPAEEDIRRLVQKAAGLFLRAATASRYIGRGRPLFARERLSNLLEEDSVDQSLVAPQLEAGCEANAVCQTSSFVDSGVGMSADGSSSVYSISYNPDARDDLVVVIIGDGELETIFGQTFDGADASATEQHINSAISQFARDLRAEATSKREKGVASIARLHSAYVANCIRKRYSSGPDQRAKEMDRLFAQRPQTRERLETYLSQHDKLEQSPDTESDEMLNTLRGAAEEEDWEENDLKHLPHLEQLESFVMSSQALVNLRGSVRKLIDSRPTISNPLITEEPQHPIEQQTQELLPQPIDVESAHSESTNVHQKGELPESICREGGYGSSETEGDVLHQKKLLLWRRINKALKRFTRPRVLEGYKRIEWTCDCGRLMYDDYKCKTSDIEKIEAELQGRSQLTPDSTSLDWNHSQEHDGGPHNQHRSVSGGGDASNGGQKYKIQNAGNAQNGGHNGVRQSHRGGATNGGEKNGNEENEDENDTSKVPKFFELCVNTGKFSITLGEINITGVESDGDLFRKIYEEYKSLRGHRISRIFIEPVNVHFVRFSVEKRYQADIYETPLSIPPPEEVERKRYHYVECPLKVQPPMGYRTFIHYMYHCTHVNASDSPTSLDDELGCSNSPAGSIFNQDIFFKRLPKKLGSGVISQDTEVSWGWGVHVIEGPNRRALSWTTFLCLLSSFIVSVVYSLIGETQEQGFSIGQWMVAVLAAGMTALYFQWDET